MELTKAAVSVIPQLISSLNDRNIAKGRSLLKEQYLIVVSHHRYKWQMRLVWSHEQYKLSRSVEQNTKCMHINCLESLAVTNSIQQFLSHLKGCNVLIRSDSTAVCQYIHHQGGTRSALLCSLTLNIWKLAIENQIQLKVTIHQKTSFFVSM